MDEFCGGKQLGERGYLPAIIGSFLPAQCLAEPLGPQGVKPGHELCVVFTPRGGLPDLSLLETHAVKAFVFQNSIKQFLS